MKAAVFASILLVSACAGASTRSDIDKQYKKFAKATVANDVDTALSILAPDYKLVTFAGTTITYDEYAESLRKRKEEGKPTQAYTTKIVKLTEIDGEAEVISEETSILVVPGDKRKWRHIHRYKDTWVKDADGWKLRRTFTIEEITK